MIYGIDKYKKIDCSAPSQLHAPQYTESMLCMISRRYSRLFCELSSQKTPRGIVPAEQLQIKHFTILTL